MRSVGALSRRAFLPLTIALLLTAAAVVPLPAFIEMPGSATGISACVGIDERPDATVNGDFLFTTVLQRDATLLGLLIAGVRDDQRVVAKDQLLGGVRRDEYVQRERVAFLDATDRAVAVALRSSGLPVDVVGAGVDVVEVVPGSAADGVLRPGDLITSVDGTPVGTDAELVAAVGADQPLRLRLRRSGSEVTEVVTPRMQELDGRQRPVIGVRIRTHAPDLRLPLDVSVASANVGGPSAGLMIGLAVHDLVDAADVAGGRRIAGTGTLALDGSVGVIGDIGMKVAAAHRRDADVFLAPAGQLAAARAAVPDGSDLRVVGVATFDEARAMLVADGDQRTRGTASAQPCRYTAGA